MTPREQSGTGAPAKRDHRQEVTDSIIKMLEDGVAPWQKPWESAGMPFNPDNRQGVSGRKCHPSDGDWPVPRI